MPYITTHSYFAKDCLKNCQKLQKIINDESKYLIFAQGFDPFFYRDFFKRSKFNHSKYYHTNNTDDFFLNFIAIIKKEKLENNPSVIAALFGHLSHYILDSNAHPYINYKTGIYSSKDSQTQKYLGLHTKMEYLIDAYLYEQKNKKTYKQYKIYQIFQNQKKLNKDLIKVLNEVYLTTFSHPHGGDNYQKGINYMYFSLKHLIYDPTNIKTSIYKILDKVIKTKISYYSSHVTVTSLDFLNLNHKAWYNPWNNYKATTSFLEIYNNALKEATDVFNATFAYLENKINKEEYQKILKNKSYVTGLPYNTKLSKPKFEF